MTLDSQGRCCGRKPIDYKGGSWRSPPKPEKFCDRCSRAFDRITGEQMANWAWQQCTDCQGWVPKDTTRPSECVCKVAACQ